jgi:peptidoglycan hydrolase CwlO-like protein
LQALKAQLKIEITNRDSQIEALEAREAGLMSQLGERDTQISEAKDQIEALKGEIKALHE